MGIQYITKTLIDNSKSWTKEAEKGVIKLEITWQIIVSWYESAYVSVRNKKNNYFENEVI